MSDLGYRAMFGSFLFGMIIFFNLLLEHFFGSVKGLPYTLAFDFILLVFAVQIFVVIHERYFSKDNKETHQEESISDHENLILDFADALELLNECLKYFQEKEQRYRRMVRPLPKIDDFHYNAISGSNADAARQANEYADRAVRIEEFLLRGTHLEESTVYLTTASQIVK